MSNTRISEHYSSEKLNPKCTVIDYMCKQVHNIKDVPKISHTVSTANDSFTSDVYDFDIDGDIEDVIEKIYKVARDMYARKHHTALINAFYNKRDLHCVTVQDEEFNCVTITISKHGDQFEIVILLHMADGSKLIDSYTESINEIKNTLEEGGHTTPEIKEYLTLMRCAMIARKTLECSMNEGEVKQDAYKYFQRSYLQSCIDYDDKLKDE